MKDRSKLVTLVALVALAAALAMAEGELPGLEAFGEGVFWTLVGLLIFFFIRGDCCGKKQEKESSASS